MTSERWEIHHECLRWLVNVGPRAMKLWRDHRMLDITPWSLPSYFFLDTYICIICLNMPSFTLPVNMSWHPAPWSWIARRRLGRWRCLRWCPRNTKRVRQCHSEIETEAKFSDNIQLITNKERNIIWDNNNNNNNNTQTASQVWALEIAGECTCDLLTIISLYITAEAF